MPLRPLPVIAALSFTLLAGLSAPVAQAQSKREQAAVAVLQQRMDAAEKRYRDAMLAVDEEAAAAATSIALAEMKGVVDACAKQHGCSVETMLAT